LILCILTAEKVNSYPEVQKWTWRELFSLQIVIYPDQRQLCNRGKHVQIQDRVVFLKRAQIPNVWGNSLLGSSFPPPWK